MAVLYKLIQDTRQKSANNGKWYARAKHLRIITTEDLVADMEKICTVTDADIWATLKALVYAMKSRLQNSFAVKIDGLGTFRIGLKTAPADTPEEFTAQKNIVGSRVNFVPETHVDSNGNRIRKFLNDLDVQILPENTVVRHKKDDDEEENPENNG